jgi:hypothetical protein
MDPLELTTMLPVARMTIVPPPPKVPGGGGGFKSVRAVKPLRPESEQPPLVGVADPTVIGPPMLTFPVTRITSPLGSDRDPVEVIVRLEN